jgi:hypothetical protein
VPTRVAVERAIVPKKQISSLEVGHDGSFEKLWTLHKQFFFVTFFHYDSFRSCHLATMVSITLGLHCHAKLPH